MHDIGIVVKETFMIDNLILVLYNSYYVLNSNVILGVYFSSYNFGKMNLVYECCLRMLHWHMLKIEYTIT